MFQNYSVPQLFQFFKRITVKYKHKLFLNLLPNNILIKFIIEEKKIFINLKTFPFGCAESCSVRAKTFLVKISHILKHCQSS